MYRLFCFFQKIHVHACRSLGLILCWDSLFLKSVLKRMLETFVSVSVHCGRMCTCTGVCVVVSKCRELVVVCVIFHGTRWQLHVHV